jgi:predicted DNA-binding protein (UPF0251 family)
MRSGRKVDVVVCWRLDRLGRNLKHLIMLVDELTALGVGFVSLHEGIDATLASVAGLPTREGARRLGVPRSTLQRLLRSA